MERSSPEQPIPAASSGREGDEIIRKVSARLPRLTGGAKHVQDRAKHGHGTEADDETGQYHQDKGAPGKVPRRPFGTGADAARHHGAGTDGQTDQHRGLEKANHAGESDCGGDWPLAKERDVEQVQQIDGENRHQPDRAGAGHDHDVAHNIASDEACFAGGLQVWHLYALELHTISPGRDGEQPRHRVGPRQTHGASASCAGRCEGLQARQRDG